MSREREEKTIRAMIAIYCEDCHQTRGELCPDCIALFEYAQARLNKCPWGEDKPVCAKCTIHCYRPAMREEIRKVMRHAGPKMLLRHPVLALDHLLRERKPAPARPARNASTNADQANEHPDADDNLPLPGSHLRD